MDLIEGLIRDLGLFARFYFFNLIGKSKSKKYILAETHDTDGETQPLYNLIFGVFISVLIIAAVLYLIIP